MDHELVALVALAATIGTIHTITGPDHYVPFIAMSKVGRWSYAKTMVVSFLCGIGHVLSSVVLGVLGIAAGLAFAGLEGFEGLRGNVAAWLLFGFGLAYTAWGVWRAIKGRRHAHVHTHADGTVHVHEHDHHAEHAHIHAGAERSMTPWILFTIFVFGPCEPLIPILMYPAAKLSLAGVGLVTAAFAVCTIGTILVLVSVAYFGLARIRLDPLARFSHALAGVAILVCGSMMLLGF
jgi:nickel/cobalt exporter